MFPIQNSFSEDGSVPYCNVGVFVTAETQCYLKPLPPCQNPAVEKNGLCIVKKSDLCEEGNVLFDGKCIPDMGCFRVDSPEFTRQHLLTGKPIHDPAPADFRETGDGMGMLYAYSGMGLVVMVLGFFGIKIWKKRT